jgi:peptidoglycan/xylan/chitin deacetylase (PgdA/CDA1 family)
MKTVLNLGFHGIGAPEGRDFGEGERDFWATRELLEATLDAAIDRPDIAISFDDGNLTDIEIVLPALLKRGLSATFFIVPGWLGSPGFIDADGVRKLADSGMTIGNHGLAHLRWTPLTPDELTHEVVDARCRLEQLSGTPIRTLAIPYGDYDDDALALVREHAYDHVFTSDGGTADPTAWLQPREHLRASHTLADLERLLAV